MGVALYVMTLSAAEILFSFSFIMLNVNPYKVF